MTKPTVFDELYPGRFLKAGLLKGQKVTLTIKDVDLEGLQDETGKTKQKAVLSFEERPMQLVACKTNGMCIKAMFGPTLATWLGKRITIFESQWNGEPCIRIWGSPDLQSDMKVSVQLPRRRPFDMVLHSVKNGKSVQAATERKAVTEPRIETAFELLDWTAEERQRFLDERKGKSTEAILSELNALLDEAEATA